MMTGDGTHSVTSLLYHTWHKEVPKPGIFSCDQAALRTRLSVRLLHVTHFFSQCSCHRIILKFSLMSQVTETHLKIGYPIFKWLAVTWQRRMGTGAVAVAMATRGHAHVLVSFLKSCNPISFSNIDNHWINIPLENILRLDGSMRMCWPLVPLT